ncbi:MAG: cyclase family protein [Desulfococcaceae bacterium]
MSGRDPKSRFRLDPPEWIDVTPPLHNGMAHWPDDPPPRFERILDIRSGDGVNLTHIDCGAHTGAHMDAPLHYIPDGPAIDDLPVSVAIGPARVVEVPTTGAISPSDWDSSSIQPGDRILFKTGKDSARKRSARKTAYLSNEMAMVLARRGVILAGIDTLSVDAEGADCPPVHRCLLSAGIWIVEGLDLSRTPAGHYDLICLPMKIAGADGAPVRAVLRPRPPFF